MNAIVTSFPQLPLSAQLLGSPTASQIYDLFFLIILTHTSSLCVSHGLLILGCEI